MSDIIKAIEAENQYLYDKTHGAKDISIYDYLSPCGYTDLSVYKRDKLFHYISEQNMEVVNVTAEECDTVGSQIVFEKINTCKSYFLWNTEHVKPIITVPISCNEDFPGYVVVKPGYDCAPDRGHILSFDGDLNMVIIIPRSLSDFFLYLRDEIVDYLRANTDDVVDIDGNDILINGEKVSGSSIGGDSEHIVVFYHISFADMTDTVREMFPDAKKVPAHISFIEPEDLLNHILSWLP